MKAIVKSICATTFKTFLLSLTIISQVHFAYAQTSASILPPAKTTFFDQNGNPLTSGKVFSYIPNTLTPKTTWQDAAETIPNLNPVVLDAAGRALILGSGNYRQIVQDKLGNIQWDQVTSSTGSGGGTGPISTGDGDLVGTIKPWAGMTAPNQYVFTYGQELSRTLFPALFTAITSTQPIFCNSGSGVLNGLSDTSNFWVGMFVETPCTTAGSHASTIVSKTATTVTIADASNITTNSTATFFPWGHGNGSTTFNLPDLRGNVLAGNTVMGGTASTNLTSAFFGSKGPNSSGATGGNQSFTLAMANLPATPAPLSVTYQATINGGASNAVAVGFGAASTAVTSTGVVAVYAIDKYNVIDAKTLTANTANLGSGTASSLIQPTITTNYIIKITPDSNSATASGVTSLGLMTGDIACGSGLLCTGNVVSVSNTSVNSHNFQIFSVPGSVTTLTLTTLPLPSDPGLVTITFDGITQARTTWSIDTITGIITFTSSIPINVQNVEVDWWSPTTLAGVNSIGGVSGNILLGSGLAISGQTLSNTNISAPVFNISIYGAIPDYHESTTLSTSGGSSVTATGSPFTVGMVGDLINITGMGVAGATYFGTITGFVNANSITVSPGLSTAQTNVFGQFCIDNTSFIQNAINATRTAGGGTIQVPVNGTYCIQHLDFTNGPAMSLKGASTVNGSRLMPMQSNIAVMDWTGTSQVDIENITVGQFNQLAIPTYGLVISPSNPNSGIDFNFLSKIFWTGQYTAATIYLDRTASSTCQKSSFLNYYQGAPNTGFVGIFTNNNIFSYSSPFATTFVGAESMSDWNFTGCEFHSIKQSGGVAAFAVLYLDNTANLQFFGGNMATSHAGIITLAPGTATNTLFQGTTFYADTGPGPVNVFTGVGNLNRTGLYFVGIGYSGAAVNITGTNTSFVQTP